MALAFGLALLGASSLMARPTAAGWTLRAEIPSRIDNIDPARSDYPPAWQIEYATCLKLVNYRDGSAPRTATLVPEAAPWPSVSKDGRTYTFRIRAGLTRFSNGRPVTAESFARALERAAARRMSSPAQPYIRDIVGANDVMEGRAVRISGVRAAGSRLVIRLKRPAGDLLTRLALPFFCAVPRNLRMSRPTAPLPSAGPYYIASWQPLGGPLVLERNSYYRGARPHGPARVVFTFARRREESFARVKRGQTDWLFEDRVSDALDRSSWGVRIPTLTTRWLAFNVTAGPLRSVRLRRAVAHALDRRALAHASGVPWGTATDHLSPPQLPGQDPRPVFSPAGDPAGLAKARELAAGLVPVKVRLLASCCGGVAQAALIRERLALIGMDVEVGFDSPIRCVPFDLALEGVWLPYPDPALTLRELVTPPAPPRHGYSCYDRRMRTPPAIWKRRLDDADRLSGAGRLRELHRLERRLATEFVPATGIYTYNSVSFFSQRIGCRRPHWVYQVDIAALCLRR